MTRFFNSAAALLIALLLFASVAAQADSSSETQESIVPPAVGAAIDEADVVFWFVCPEDDSFENGAAFNAARFPDAPPSSNDAPWAEHKELLELLKSNNIAGRVEHLAASQFAECWEAAKQNERLPNFVMGRLPFGPFTPLLSDGVFREVSSPRLRCPDATSPCRDFVWLSRIWHLRTAPNPELAEQTISLLLAPRPDALLGKLALSNPQRVVATSFAKRVVATWLKYDFDQMHEYWHSKAPQRLSGESISKEDEAWMKSESAFRDGAKLGKVTLYGAPDLLIAMVETEMQRELESQPAWFIARSSVYRGPVCVVIAREGDVYRVLAVGIWQYELGLVDTTPEAFFRAVDEAIPAGDAEPEGALEPGKPEILAPTIGEVIGNDAFKVKWRVQGAGKEDNFFCVAMGSAGMMTIKRLEAGKVFEESVRCSSEIAIWNLAGNGRIEFSNLVQLVYDPE